MEGLKEQAARQDSRGTDMSEGADRLNVFGV